MVAKRRNEHHYGEGKHRGSSVRITVDHDEIREWAELRGAWPARVRGTDRNGSVGMLQLDFPGYSGASRLEEISWDEFFQKFDESNLAFITHKESGTGERSHFYKLVKLAEDSIGEDEFDSED